jgi:anti-sigma regulatory factor (Ser/Thr protein kinase)
MLLEVKPKWEESDRVREESNHFLKANGISHDIAYALSMTACELFENAVKYGTFHIADTTICVAVEFIKSEKSGWRKERKFTTIRQYNTMDQRLPKSIPGVC